MTSYLSLTYTALNVISMPVHRLIHWYFTEPPITRPLEGGITGITALITALMIRYFNLYNKHYNRNFIALLSCFKKPNTVKSWDFGLCFVKQ